MNWNELYQFESHLENGFRGVLSDVCPNRYVSMEHEDSAGMTPKIRIHAEIGEAEGHKHTLEFGNVVHDVFLGSLTIELRTNRTSDIDAGFRHGAMVAKIRNLCQAFRLCPQPPLMASPEAWSKWQQVLFLADIIPQGTVDSFVDENDIDVTVQSFNLLFSVNPAMWPTTS